MAKPSLNAIPESNKYYTQLTIRPYKRNDGFKLASDGPPLIVRLPLPTEMRDDTTVGYTPVNLETVGDIFNKSDAYSGAMARNSGNILSAIMGATKRGFEKTGAVGELLGGAMNIAQSLLPAEQVTSALQQQNGIAPNPNPSVQFQGPVLRDFTLTWAFYPKNVKESEEIDLLIRKLKARALPSLNDPKKPGSSSILNFPDTCQINFYPWDNNGKSENNGWAPGSIIKIKKCFMSGVNVNYHAFGTPAFFADTTLPVTYQLTINFKEIEYLLASDWDAAGDDTTKARQDYANNAFSGTTDSFIAGLKILPAAVENIGTNLANDLSGLLEAAEPPAKTPSDQKVADVSEIKAITYSLNGRQQSPVTHVAADGTKYETFGDGPQGKFKWYVRVTNKDGTISEKQTKPGTFLDYSKEFSTSKEAIDYLTEKDPWGAKPAQ